MTKKNNLFEDVFIDENINVEINFRRFTSTRMNIDAMTKHRRGLIEGRSSVMKIFASHWLKRNYPGKHRTVEFS